MHRPDALVLPPIRPHQEDGSDEPGFAVEVETLADPEPGESPADDPKPQPPPIKLAKRYFHILGIDVLVDSDLNPNVLELNDRPSLGVTVEFEKDLKELVIAEAFEHICPNGDVRGDSPETSRWRQILPEQSAAGPWREIVRRMLNPNLPPMDPTKLRVTHPTRSRLEFKQNRKKKRRTKKEKTSNPDASPE
jgi:hypothetical protein